MFQNQSLLDETVRLRKFSLRLTRNNSNSDDLLQSTLLRALENKSKFIDSSNLFSWTSKIMLNIFISSYRRKKKYESQYDPEPLINKLAVEADQENKVDLSFVGEAMNKIKPSHRKILLLVCAQGFSYEEAAKILSIPIGTVRSRLSRARHALTHSLNSKVNLTTLYVAGNA